MTQPTPRPTKSWKAAVAAVGTTLTIIATSWTTISAEATAGPLTGADYARLGVAAIIAVASVVAVWRVPNPPKV